MRSSDTIPLMRVRIVFIAGGLLLAAIAAGLVLLLGGGALPLSSSPREPLVLLDAGHGGRDPGAVHEGVREAVINLAVAERVYVLLQDDPRVRVSMTRTGDTSISLEQRMALANKSKAAAYVSLHANTYHDPRVRGIETLVSETQPPGSPSWQLAEILQRAVTTATGARDRGVRSQDLYLHHAKMPAVLLEMGFMTSPQESALLLTPAYQQRLATAIYEGILEYLAFALPSFSGRP
jgi:N-acetylmuramoyl-L-alanine amidase